MNNSTKPLSESELAKQKVLAVYPKAWEHSGGSIWDKKGRAQNYEIGDNWIDAASMLPQPLSEDGIESEPNET